MKILFDLSSIQSSGENIFHGGGEYAKSVFYKLCDSIKNKNIILEVFYISNKIIDENIINICKNNNYFIHKVIDHDDINNILKNNNYNVFYSALPYSYYDLKIPNKTMFIYTIHGLRTLEYQKDKYYFKYTKLSIKKKIRYILSLSAIAKNFIDNLTIKKFKGLFSVTSNQKIITISNHSKYSIAYFFPNIGIANINVFYAPLKDYKYASSGNESNVLESFNVSSDKYILIILGNRNGKGTYRACMVLNNLINKKRGIPDDIKIVLLGVTYKKHYLKLVKNNPRFIFRDYVASEDLEVLYKNAHLFLYPTLNEGFGYPPLEAMKYNTVCAGSAVSSITEVYGDSIIYFNPFDNVEMGNRILQSFDENIRNEYKKRIKKQFEIIRNKQIQDLDLLIKEIIQENE